MSRGDVPVVVLGGGVSGLGVLRAFARRSITTYLVAPPGDLAWRSRHARPAPGRSDASAAADLPTFLTSLDLRRAVLLPCSDAWARKVAALPQDVAAHYRSSSPSADALDAVVDKANFAALTRRAGVAHPESWPLDGVASLAGVPEDAFESAFLKPRDSQAFFRRFGVKAFWVRSREEAARRLAELENTGLGMQLQRYVPGPPANHVFVDGFVDRSGVVRCHFVRRRLRMYPPDFGNSSLMESIHPAEAPDAVAAAERLVATLEYRGIFSLETKRDEKSGACHALELNPRAWWYVGFAVDCGADVCRLAYEDALGEPVATIATYRVGRRCAYPSYDWSAVRQLRGGVSFLSWAADMVRADQPVWAWSDPGPALGEAWRTLKARLGRTVG
jgi:predicted ATP-grasp superfamily ATP-dependent carboligase